MKKIEKMGEKIRYLFQAAPPGQAIVNNALGGNQSNFISSLFNPNTDLTMFFNTLFKGAIVIGAMLAVLRLGYAGFLYMTSDVWGNKSKAREIIQEAVLGLLLLLGIWLILNQINPNLLNLNIFQSVSNPPTSGGALPGSRPVGSGGIGSQ